MWEALEEAWIPQAMWSTVVRKGVQGGTGLLGNGPN